MKISLFILLIVVLLGCQKKSLPYYHNATFTPHWRGADQFDEDTIHRIASFSFMDQKGNYVTNESMRGKMYVANFFFTACPGICPKMKNELTKVQQVFAHDTTVMILSHSVMPWADSVSRLNQFAELNAINYPQWRLLTGKQSEIYSLARLSYFAEEVAGYKRDSTDFVHTEHCLLVDKEGHLRGLYNGTLALEIDRLIEDIHILQAED